MKTEQEQTKQMLKTLCDKFQCSAIDRSYMAKSCRQCEDIIEALHEAGYGDISEYKAEIERLRTTLGQCNTELNSALESLKSQCREIGALKAGTKQAKIDVLNELREKCKFDGHTVAVYKNDIDELIKEVQNAENKG